MSILFCTSFNQELYEASGKNLVSSFVKFQETGNLFIGYEDLETSWIVENHPKFKLCDLNKDEFLQTWLEENKDIIPKYLGGEAVPCNCPTPMQRKPETHIGGCRYNWFNRNCSRWFRKIATLHAAYNKKVKYLIWIDADCEFKKEITIERLDKIFGDNFSVFYMCGTRSIPETGVFGFNLDQIGGHNFLNQYFYYYQAKRFRKYHRWDDSNIFYRILKEKTAVNCIAKDIVKHIPGQVNVLKDSLLKDYLTHAKGLHGMRLGIMK